MKLLTTILYSIPSLVFAQIDTSLFSEVEKSKLIETEQLDWAKIERYEKGTIVYTSAGLDMGQEKRIYINVDGIEYSRHLSNNVVAHYKTDPKSKAHIKHGYWTSYLRSGSKLVIESCNYVNDTLDGEHLVFENNSAGYFLEYRANYKMGVPNGLYEKYDRQGKLATRGQFINGEKVGVWIINENEYHAPDGTEYYAKCTSCYFTTTSVYKEFFSDGIIDSEVEINKPISPSLYVRSAKLIKVEQYKNNVFISCEGECD